MSKQQLVDAGEPHELVQIGPECFAQRLSFPPEPPDQTLAEPVITTFMVDTSDRSIESLEDQSDHTSFWLPQVEWLTALVLDRLDEHGVTVASQAFATVSLTHGNDVNDEPHFDDGMFEPLAGVGAVAVVGSGDGPRVATTPLPANRPRPGTLVEVSGSNKADFVDQTINHVSVDDGVVALFPQFAQLHSGPGPIAEEVRQLMVFRVGTVPVS